ncbi:M28 family peptidase [Undibacterium sp. RTI2.1]|uniref:M28 family peptidase n=1 Tax=unclassified Undibacterium TaxID=2630295 RepID=UPI002B22B6E2|nr:MULTISPECIES: M28 family peptidase [unclassified Undibacterium]MEB0029942.1 M28 family peptidase [Undibacterium sp. RTI2.1]MEB0117094.1 M28 family peptidase [Undibacterium sp. RTI2.2]MEB0229966.1 M28 family peptidase [Undibacterium sp. 10I3]MEB0259503.1 M28 family peptidase [Undibacterium sp. 5I1]
MSSLISHAIAQPTETQAMMDVKKLASAEMAGRATDTPGSQLAREYIIGRLQGLGIKPCNTDFIQTFDVVMRNGEHKRGSNIIACQSGTLLDHANATAMIVSAHYDHLGVRGGKTYFGADDNASGVAGVLAIAEAMQKTLPQHDVIYILFDAEELGLQGSRAFASKPPIDIDRVGININFDMIARGDKGELYASGTYHTPSLKPILAPLDASKDVKVLFGHDRPEQGQDDWTKQSDHYNLFAAGIPFIYFGVEDHPDYHQPTDTADKINPVFFMGAVELVTKTTYLIDQALVTTSFRRKS